MYRALIRLHQVIPQPDDLGFELLPSDAFHVGLESTSYDLRHVFAGAVTLL